MGPVEEPFETDPHGHSPIIPYDLRPQAAG